MAAIELSSVTKQFGDVVALNNVNLTVESGEIYGFLGPNGAGKTTTIDLLLDFVRPTEGTVRVLGQDAREHSVGIRSATGVLPEGYGVYPRLTGRQHLEFAIESKSAGDTPESILSRVGLLEDADRRAGGYSAGMRQRLALGMALVGAPDLLILDEPSTGLDPNGAREMRSIVQEEVDRGATVFFSSHILSQVEAVCDRVGILRNGELVAEDSVAGLREAVGTESTLTVSVTDLSEPAIEAVRSLEGVSEARTEGEEFIVRCQDNAKTAVLEALEDNGATVENFETQPVSLEELFAAYTEGDHSEVAA